MERTTRREPTHALKAGSREPQRRPVVAALAGCTFIIVVVAISAGLLFINALFALSLFAILPKAGSDELNARIGQFFYFVVPLFLLILEWHVWDRIRRMFRSDVASR